MISLKVITNAAAPARQENPNKATEIKTVHFEAAAISAREHAGTQRRYPATPHVAP